MTNDQIISNIFSNTVTAVFNFLRTASFFGVSLINWKLAVACASILIFALLNIVRRPAVETTSGKRSRIATEQYRAERRQYMESRKRRK